MLNDKTILVTGGTGSFGKKFAQRVFEKYQPRKLIVYSRDEYKQFLVRQQFDAYKDRVRFFIGDVRDKERLYRAFRGVDYVVHAAALKQIPSCEYNPFEAVKTNIYGAQNIVDAAIDCGVKRVVALSTDKAVNPINLYGATKLASDKIFIAANAYAGAQDTVFSIVRYGNVAGSRGSVIPFFKMLLDSGKNELPITDRQMTRFWITLDQAVDLVFKALEESKGGETYISKIPSFKIVDLAAAMSPQAKLKDVGIREGEKLHEIMITEYDSFSTHEYPDHYIIYPNSLEWWTEQRLTPGGKKVKPYFRYASDENPEWLTVEDMQDRLRELEIVPLKGSDVGFIPYGRQWIDEADEQRVLRVLRSDFLTQGPEVARFEQALLELTGAKYCVAVSSGTAALHLAVAALGIEKGAEGITSPITFVASANAMLYSELVPRFADIDPGTYNLDPSEVGKKLTAKTRLLLPVHFAGQPADMPALHALARRSGCRVIEDASHAIGSTYSSGDPVGSCRHSDLTVFSFHPVKTITTGEGGAITTNDPELHERLLLSRTHGITRDPSRLGENPGPWYYEMQDLGFNYRLTDLQAALGISQLGKLDRFRNRRRQIVAAYNQAFLGTRLLTTPYEDPSVVSCFHLYVLQADFVSAGRDRREVMEALRGRDIGTQVHYIPVHLQPYYRHRFGYGPGDFPVAESYYRRALSIPLYPAMQEEQVHEVVAGVRDALGIGRKP